MPDETVFLRCEECGDTFPWSTLRGHVRTPPDAGTVVCPTCGADEFDRTDGPTTTVREWTYRGRACEVREHYMGHYLGYVAYTEQDREEGYAVEHEALHPPEGDAYTPHGGVTWVDADEELLGFDCHHAFDVCLRPDGHPWGFLGRRSSEIYLADLDPEDPESFERVAPHVRLWTRDGVIAEVEALAAHLPDRSDTQS